MQLALFRKKQNKKNKAPQITLCKGVTMVGEVSMGDMTRGQDALVKGLSEALIVFGSVGGFLSCLDVSYHIFAVAIAYILVAAYFSYLFKTSKGWLRDMGYIAYFIAFIIGVRILNRHINSGFYAILNVIYKMGSDYFDMSATREFTEMIGNRPLTITVAAIFIGSVAILILNVFLSRYMSVMAAVFMSIPIFMIPLFFEREPDSLYVLLLFAGIASVIIQKGSGHFVKNKNDTQFSYSAGKRRGRITYAQSGKAVAQMIAHMVILSLLVLSMSFVIYPKERFTYRHKDSTLKADVLDSVENVMLAGFESLFNFYGSTSGMSGGKLGGVGSIRSDYQPDLKVTFAPYSYRTLYLKGFTGENYIVDHWTEDPDGVLRSPVDSLAQGVMEIENVGADYRYLYMPYFCEEKENLKERYSGHEGIPTWNTEVYTYYPLLRESRFGKSVTFPEEEIKSSYLDVPVGNYSTIQRFCQDLGVSEGDSESEIIEKVVNYFQDNIPYTLRPGAMPKNSDFVNYFLEKNKKGYCAHFASAATLIFRFYGIPARYAEGYAIDYFAITEGELVENKEYSDYYQGSSELGETAVVEVTATDANAHAWVEVYLNGMWQPVEVTPASDEEETEDFWTIFGNWLSPNDRTQAESTTTGGGTTALSKDRLSKISRIVISLFGLFVLLLLSRFIWKKTRRIKSYHGKDASENVVAYYRYMCDCMRLATPDFKMADSHLAQITMMMPNASEEEQRQLAGRLEQVSYGCNTEGIDLNQFIKTLKDVQKQRLRSYGLMTRWSLFVHL